MIFRGWFEIGIVSRLANRRSVGLPDCYQTEFFNVRPALKRTDLDALVLMASPDRVFRPLRAPRFETVKVPKPVIPKVLIIDP